MTRERLNIGCHRLGMVLAAPFGVIAVVGVALAVFGHPSGPNSPIAFALVTLCIGTAVYGACRASAWIAAGFLGV